MPTLRNKTTDSGLIVRWKPHPKHPRPSTYQVTPRARSFFEDLGYSVPSPGDEAAIPHQLCRPLRLLGDLYFESSSQEDLELGNPPGQGYYESPSVSEAELDELRSYVEAHPSYIGGLRDGLDKELPESSQAENEADISRPRLKPEARNIRETADGRTLLPEPFHLGQVDRLSNNRNAILNTASGKEVNLGSLPKSVVGEWTVGVEYRGIWMMCLTPQVWGSGYRSDAREYIEKLERLTGLTGLQKILNIESRHYNQDLHDSELEVFVSFAGHGLGVAYHGEWTILVDSELVAANQRVNVAIESVHGNVAIATPHRPRDDSQLAGGDCVDIDISKIGQNSLIGSKDGTLVMVPRESSTVPDEISIAITEVCEGYVSGTLEALDESKRPSQQEFVTVREGVIEEYDGIPVALPEIPLADQTRIRLPVTSVNPDGVEVSTDELGELGMFESDETISSTIQEWTSEGLFLRVDGVPIRVRGARYVPGVTIEAKPTGFEEGFVEAELERYVVPELACSIDGGFETGNEQMQRGEFQEALPTFTSIVEQTDIEEEPELWMDGVVHETIALTATPVTKGEYEEALRLLAIRVEDIQQNEELPQRIRNIASVELAAYRSIINGLSHMAVVEQTDDGAEKTSRRQEAKECLSHAVDELNEFHSISTRRKAHKVIDEKFREGAKGLLLPSESVKDYIQYITKPVS
ncbi:hypothetical protein PNQ29_06795 [Halobacterium salinarum]|uniref:hypothetical protein n=1 Tax=Halobacterium salinarum TaxID=2242 RepID=UPI00255520B7|nr:hypothetical protein [Halobacterium salinarum]MDL0119436.1 hypothetical protein [Halobacterium salinarum]